MTNPENEIFIRLEKAFLPEKAIGINVIVQVNLASDAKETWLVTIKDQKCTIAQGSHSAPSMEINTNQETFLGIVRQELDPMSAYFSGKIQIKGSRRLLLKFKEMFHLEAD